MNLISIDLGKNLAIAFWEDKLCTRVITLTFDDSLNHVENLVSFFRTIKDIIQNKKPIVVVEEIGRNNPGMGLQYIQYMDIRELSKQYGCKFVSFHNSTIKKTVSGNGKSDKNLMRKSVLDSSYCAIEPSNEHEVDSIAVGITYFEKND